LRRQNFPHQFAQPRSPIGFQFQTRATADRRVAWRWENQVSLCEPGTARICSLLIVAGQEADAVDVGANVERAAAGQHGPSPFSQPKPFCNAFGKPKIFVLCSFFRLLSFVPTFLRCDRKFEIPELSRCKSCTAFLLPLAAYRSFSLFPLPPSFVSAFSQADQHEGMVSPACLALLAAVGGSQM
jgi:hypothetical protein